jgi:dihydrofolate synthase/folylpolyglutamate synthase
MALAVGIPISDIQEGLKSVFWPGRLEVVSSQGVDITMDCAHNPAGIKAFFDYVSKGDNDKIDLTFGVLDTKNWREMLQVLLPKVDTLRLVRPESDRALDLGLIEKEIQLSGTDVRIHRYEGDYERCLHDILASSENGKAYITGSMYMIGAMRAMLGVEERPLWKRAIAHQESIEN